MTFKFDSGLSVRIPNDQLIVPNLTIEPQTGQLLANSSDPELVLNAIQQVNAGDLPQLGRQFLSSAYLMVNQDADEFTLWTANPTANEDLVAVDTHNRVVEEFCSPTTPGGSAPTGSSPGGPGNGIPGQSSAKLSGGAIAGIAIGAVAVIAIVGGLIFWCITRRKATLESGPGFTSMVRQRKADTTTSSTYITPEAYGKSELSGNSVWENPRLQELPT